MIRLCDRGSAEGLEKAFKWKMYFLAVSSNALLRPPSLPHYAAHTNPVLRVVFHNRGQNVDIVAFDYSLSSVPGNAVDTRYAAHRQL